MHPPGRFVGEYPIKLFRRVEAIFRVRVTVLGSELAPAPAKTPFLGEPQRKKNSWYQIKASSRK